MGKWLSMTAMTVATTLGACAASQQSARMQPVLALNGKPIKNSGAEYERGKKLLSEGRFAVAAESFQAVMFANGPSVKLLNALAVSYDQLRRYDLSDQYYERALMLDPESAQTANNLAVSMARRGVPDIATKLLADARAHDPNNKTITANLARIEAEAKKPAVPVTTGVSGSMISSVNEVPRIEIIGATTQLLVTTPHPVSEGRVSPSALLAPNAGSPSAPLTLAAEAVAKNVPEGRMAGEDGPNAAARKPAKTLSDGTSPGANNRSGPQSPAIVDVSASTGTSHASSKPFIPTRELGHAAAIQAPSTHINGPHPEMVDSGVSRTKAGSETAVATTKAGSVNANQNDKASILQRADRQLPAPSADNGAGGKIAMSGSSRLAGVWPATGRTSSVDHASFRPLVTGVIKADSEGPSRKSQKGESIAADGTANGNQHVAAPPTMTWAGTETATLPLVADRLGSRIAESQNIDPLDAPLPTQSTEFPGMHVGISIGASNAACGPTIAVRMRSLLGQDGFDFARMTNDEVFDGPRTIVFYRPEISDLSKANPTDVELKNTAHVFGKIQVMLGRDLLVFDPSLERKG